MRRFILAFLMLLFLSPVLFSQTEGNKRYISVKEVLLKDSTGFFAKELRALFFADEVSLIREEGKWAQIQAKDLRGWVSSSALSVRRIVEAGMSASASEISLAGKGFSKDIEIEYLKNGLDYSMVDSMEKVTVPSPELLNFITDGRLTKGEN